MLSEDSVIHGEVKEFRSDHTTTFVGAAETLKMENTSVDDVTNGSVL